MRSSPRANVFVLLAAVPLIAVSILAAISTVDGAQRDPVEPEQRRELTLVNEKGKPVSNARVTISGSRFELQELVTDKVGRVSFNYRDRSSVGIQVLAPGYASIKYFPTIDGEPLPEDLRIVMSAAITVGGLVTDRMRRPVAEAEVRITVSQRFPGTKSPNHPYSEIEHHIVHTDSQGRWACDVFPREWRQLIVWISHPDYLCWEFTKPLNVPVDELIDQTWTVALPDGVKLTGTLLDEEANPIEGGNVTYAPIKTSEFSWALTETDEEGRFTLGAMPEGRVTFVVAAKGFTPRQISSVIGPGVPPLVVRMSRGETLVVTFVDETGGPAKDADVHIWDWVGDKAVEGSITPKQLDEEGRWMWDGMPDRPFKIRVYSKNYVTEEFPISPSRSDYKFTLQSLPKVLYRGRVVDAQSGEAVQRFTVVPYSLELPLYLFEDIFADDGEFEYAAPMPHGPSTLCVEATGYVPKLIGPFAEEDSPVQTVVELTPETE